MKVLYKGSKFTVEFEGGQKEIFRDLAQFQEIFETNNEHCSAPTLFGHRQDKEGNNYYEKRCQKCGKTFAYGQKKKGEVLFPNYTKGWHKWVPADQEEEAPFDIKPTVKAGKK